MPGKNAFQSFFFRARAFASALFAGAATPAPPSSGCVCATLTVAPRVTATLTTTCC